MKELLIMAVIFATTCLLLLLRSLIVGGRQERHYRINQLYFDVISTGIDDRKQSDEWPSTISLDDESAAQVKKPSAEDERIELTIMQDMVFRLLP